MRGLAGEKEETSQSVGNMDAEMTSLVSEHLAQQVRLPTNLRD